MTSAIENNVARRLRGFSHFATYSLLPHGDRSGAQEGGGAGEARHDDAGGLANLWIPAALICVRFVKAQLYELTNADATVMAFAIVSLAVAACITGMIPARRAASIDPMRALRME